VPMTDAIPAAVHYCKSVAAMVGIVKRVIVTDSGDCIVFEWLYGGGLVYPPIEDLKDN
jgi:hypothetical protein